MRLNQSQLNNLPVYTKNNDFLGRISSFELDCQTHQVVNYKLGSSSLLRSLLGEQQLVISSQSVISITEEKMIVNNSVIKEENLVTKKILSKQVASSLQKEL